MGMGYRERIYQNSAFFEQYDPTQVLILSGDTLI
jgi:ADP-glucose pyrophosphorylase